jgi:PAS domain S-box-containing protein
MAILIMALIIGWFFYNDQQKERSTEFQEADHEASVQVALSHEEKAWLKAHPDIKLGYTYAFQPDVIVNPDGGLRGIQVDILAELNRRLRTRIGLQIYPVAELIDKAQKKEVDGILNLHPDYADNLGLLKTNSYFTGYPAVFARKGVSFDSPSDLADKRVAIIDKVFFSEQLVAQHGRGATILKVQDAEEGLQLIDNGQADFFLGATLNSYLITKYQLLDLVTEYIFYDDRIDAVIGTRSDWPELSAILDKGLSSFSKEEIEAIVAKWTHLPEKQQVRVELTPEEQAWLAQNHTVRVRVGEYPPNYFIKNGKPFGIAIDILNEISKRSGIKFHFVIPSGSFSNDLKGLLEHTGPDIIPSLQSTPEREGKILFTKPYMTSPRFIFTRDDAPFVSSMEDLVGKTVAVEETFLVHEWLANDYPDINLLLCENTEEALVAISSGKAFAYIGPLRATSSMINTRGLHNLKATGPSSLPDGITAMGIRNDWPEVQSILNKGLDLISEQEKAAIIGKWSVVRVEHGIKPEDVLKWVLVGCAIAVGIGLLLVFWNRSLNRRVHLRTAEVVEGQARFRNLMEQSPLSIQITNPDGSLNQVNPAFMKLWGINKKALGELYQKYNVLQDEQARELGVMPLLERAYKGEQITLPPIQYDPVETMDKLHFIESQGKKKWIQTRLYPIRDNTGRISNIVHLEEDITERKEAEEQMTQLRSELLHSTRVGTMIELTAALAHEINHPLGSILNNANAAKRMLEGENPDLDEIREIIADIVSEDRRAGDVIQKLRALMKKTEVEFAPRQVNDIIEEVLQLAHSELIMNNISLTKDLEARLPKVNADHIQLQQVFLNLIINACDAMKESSEKRLHIATTIHDSLNIVVCVRDSGTGIDEENMNSLFEAFFTTRREGMGMGLSVSKTIIEAHNGRIWAENNEGAGASVFVSLPVYDEEVS